MRSTSPQLPPTMRFTTRTIVSLLLLGLAVTLVAAESAGGFSYRYQVKDINVTGGFTYTGTGSEIQESGSVFQGLDHSPSLRSKDNIGFLRYPPPQRFGLIGSLGTPAFKRKYQQEAGGNYGSGLVTSCNRDGTWETTFGAFLGYKEATEEVVVEWHLGFDPLGCGSAEWGVGFLIEPHDPHTKPCNGYLIERYPLKTFQAKEFTLPVSLNCDWTPPESSSNAESREAHIAWTGSVVLRRLVPRKRR